MRVFEENRRNITFTNEVDYEGLSQEGSQEFVCPEELTVDGCFVFTKNGKLLNWVSEWLSDKMELNAINHNTAREYGKIVTYFLDFLMKREVRYRRPKPSDVSGIQDLLLNVSKSIVLEFLNVECAELSNGTKSIRDEVIKQFYTEYICNPSYGLKQVAHLDPYYNPFNSVNTEGELEIKSLFNGKAKHDENSGGAISLDNLMDYMVLARSERERCMYQFMMDSGLRIDEMPKVRRSDIEEAINSFSNRLALDEEENFVLSSNYKACHVDGVKARQREESKPRVTLVSKITLERINRYFKDRRGFYHKHTRRQKDPAAFLDAKGNPITPASIHYYVTERFKEGKQIGLFEGRNNPITAHKFRHGFAVLCLVSPDFQKDAHNRMVALSKWLGHNNTSTTEKHYQSIAVELQLKLDTGELLNRGDLMKEVYAKTKPSEIESYIAERLGIAPKKKSRMKLED